MTEQELFEEAIKLSGVDRERFLNAACSDDEALKQRISNLLRAHDATEGAIPRLLPQDATQTEESATSTKIISGTLLQVGID